MPGQVSSTLGGGDMIVPAVAGAYDRLADRWADQHFDRTQGLRQHQRAVAFADAGPAGWALNVGCGCSTRFNDLLRSPGLQLEAIDVSGRMVALARAADPAATVHHADVCSWEPTRRYRLISAWDSLWHVPLDRQRALLLKLMSALEPRGVFIFSAGGLDQPAEHWDSAMGPAVYYATPGIPGLLGAAADAGCICRHLEFDQHPATHLCVIVQKAA